MRQFPPRSEVHSNAQETICTGIWRPQPVLIKTFPGITTPVENWIPPSLQTFPGDTHRFETVKLLKLTYPGHPWNQVTSGHGKKNIESRVKSRCNKMAQLPLLSRETTGFFNLEAKLPGFVPLRDCELLARNPRAKKNACGLGTCVKYYMSLRIDSLLFSCPTCAKILPFSRLRLISSNKSNCSANVCGYFPLTFHFSWCHFLHACLACFSRLARFVQCILSSF